jgi:molecular chaperone DnaK (HSP70)
LRLLDSIEKVRKLLTSNKEADVHCEALMEDEDLHRHINRDELEELIAPFVGRFRKCLEEALAASGKYNYNISAFSIFNSKYCYLLYRSDQ